jgi:uncharacterized protein (TIGR00255 family)
MTGFGQTGGENARHAVTVTIRAVNHRFLELRLGLGDDYRASEEALRALLSGELTRGRVDAVVEVRALAARAARVRVDREVVRAAHAAVEELFEGGLVGEKLTAGDLLRLPEVLAVERDHDLWDAADQALLLGVAGEALIQLVAGREGEGAALQVVLARRLDELAAVVETLTGLREASRAATLESLRARLDELLGAAGVDPARLAQEAAILVERSDVAEELDRLGSHCHHFRELLAAAGAAGKRLDFLAQEIGRELNTVGAKCRDAAMTRAVLDGKLLCEQLREQVQNVE